MNFKLTYGKYDNNIDYTVTLDFRNLVDLNQQQVKLLDC